MKSRVYEIYGTNYGRHRVFPRVQIESANYGSGDYIRVSDPRLKLHRIRTRLRHEFIRRFLQMNMAWGVKQAL